MANKIIDFLYTNAEMLCKDAGLEVWGVDIVGSTQKTVRIFVDKPKDGVSENTEQNDGVEESGIGIIECARISRKLSLIIDVEEIFKDAWTLEVSSPGFSRLFFNPNQMKDYIGRSVEVVLSAQMPNYPKRKKFKGNLLSIIDDSKIEIEIDKDTLQASEEDKAIAIIPWTHVKRANLIHVFTMPEKPGKSKQNKATQGGNK